MGLSLIFWMMHISMSIMGFIMHGHWREQIHHLFSHTSTYNGAHTLTLSGHIEPYQGKTNPIDLTLTYMTNSDNCLGSSFLMGANSSNQTKSRYFRLEPNSHHDYHLEIPINEFSPGLCDLEPFMLRFSNQHYSQSIIMFDEKDKTSHVPTQHLSLIHI